VESDGALEIVSVGKRFAWSGSSPLCMLAKETGVAK
jgi:hypothetical protein